MARKALAWACAIGLGAELLKLHHYLVTFSPTVSQALYELETPPHSLPWVVAHLLSASVFVLCVIWHVLNDKKERPAIEYPALGIFALTVVLNITKLGPAPLLVAVLINSGFLIAVFYFWALARYVPLLRVLAVPMGLTLLGHAALLRL